MTESLLPQTFRSHPEKYGHLERERRYLLHRRPSGLTPGAEQRRITDRYLVGTSLRLRHVLRPATGENLWKLTQKVRSIPTDGANVFTTTFSLSEQEHDLMLGLETRQIVKDRFLFEHRGTLFGMDVFRGALTGLILAETECVSAEAWEAMALPDFAVLDVSREEAFTGGALAMLTASGLQALLARFPGEG